MTTGEIISVAVSAIVTIVVGIIVWILKSYIADLKKYREERETKEQAKEELMLGLTRVSLLENYYKCEKQGYYPLKDREVYGTLFEAYKVNGGNGVIDQIAVNIRELPMLPPSERGDEQI